MRWDQKKSWTPLHHALDAVWHGIAPDVLASQGKEPTTGADVQEFVGYAAECHLEEEYAILWKAMSWDLRDTILKEVFPGDVMYGY